MSLDDLEIMDADSAEQLDVEWPDVYFTPAYGRAVAAWRNWPWRVAIWTPSPIIFPFLMRPIDRSLTGGMELYDAVSPYGYSGTTALANANVSDWKAFRDAWHRAARDLGIVGEFQRFSPFVPGREELCAVDGSLRPRRHNTIVTVACQDVARYWQSASSTVRNRVRRAERLGYEAIVSVASEGDLAPGSAFRAIYEATMRQVGASSEFLFPDHYYTTLVDHLRDAVLVCHVLGPSGEVVSAGLFFRWGTTAHFHVAGSDPAVRRDGCNILRLDRQIRWASEVGSTLVNLGGGRSDDDPVYKFKTNFGSGREPFFVGTTVLDERRAAQLAAGGYAP